MPPVDGRDPGHDELVGEPLPSRRHEEERPAVRGDECEAGASTAATAASDRPRPSLLQPVARPVERGECRGLRRDPDAQHVPLERGGDAVDELRGPRDEPEAEVGEQEALAEAADHHHALGARERRREVDAPECRLVGLVGDDHEAVAACDREGGRDLVGRRAPVRSG